jgi:hypothetical protein
MPKKEQNAHGNIPRRRFLRQIGAIAGFPAILTSRAKRPNILWIMSDEQRRVTATMTGW